jgi:hypothetical protein
MVDRAKVIADVKETDRAMETSRAMETVVARAKENVTVIDRTRGIDGMRIMDGDKPKYLVASIFCCLPQHRPILFWRS